MAHSKDFWTDHGSQEPLHARIEKGHPADQNFTEKPEQLERRLGADRLPSGNVARNGATAMELTIILSDGCEVRVAMKGLRLDSAEKI